LLVCSLDASFSLFSGLFSSALPSTSDLGILILVISYNPDLFFPFHFISTFFSDELFTLNVNVIIFFVPVTVFALLSEELAFLTIANPIALFVPCAT